MLKIHPAKQPDLPRCVHNVSNVPLAAQIRATAPHRANPEAMANVPRGHVLLAGILWAIIGGMNGLVVEGIVSAKPLLQFRQNPHVQLRDKAEGTKQRDEHRRWLLQKNIHSLACWGYMYLRSRTTTFPLATQLWCHITFRVPTTVGDLPTGALGLPPLRSILSLVVTHTACAIFLIGDGRISPRCKPPGPQ